MRTWTVKWKVELVKGTARNVKVNKEPGSIRQVVCCSFIKIISKPWGAFCNILSHWEDIERFRFFNIPSNTQTVPSNDRLKWTLGLSATRKQASGLQPLKVKRWRTKNKCIRERVIACCPQVHTEMVIWSCRCKPSERAKYKPWLEESTLSSQSAADSTGKDEVRGKERKQYYRMTNPCLTIMSEVTVITLTVHESGDQRGWMLQHVSFMWSCNMFEA